MIPAPTLFETMMSGAMMLAMVQGILLIVMILKVRRDSVAHRMLVWIIFIAVLNLIPDVVFAIYQNVDLLLNLLLVAMGSSLAAPPLIYLYTDLITRKNRQSWRTSWWHFLPSFSFLFIFTPFLLVTNQSLSQLNQNDIQPISITVIIISELFFLFQFTVYIVLSILKLRRHRKNIEDIFSDTERINLNWLRNVLLCLSAICVLMIVQTVVEMPSVFLDSVNNTIMLLVVALIYTLGYLGMRQGDIFGVDDAVLSDAETMPSSQHISQPTQAVPEVISEHHQEISQATAVADVSLAKHTDIIHTENKEPINTQIDTSDINGLAQSIEKSRYSKESELNTEKDEQQQTIEPPEKYQSSALDKETSKLLFDDLLGFMENQKPYLESNLSLSGLAKQVKLSNNYLSQIINEQSQNNFFDFINRYRVNHFKTLLAKQLEENKTSNMIDTALASGFNSKSAFYSAFKKYEGMTPSQYKKSIQPAM